MNQLEKLRNNFIKASNPEGVLKADKVPTDYMNFIC